MVDVGGEEARPAVEVVESVGLQLELEEGVHAVEGADLQRLDVTVCQVQDGHLLKRT